jgi:histidinol phosphatase-like PHP family hydrolase
MCAHYETRGPVDGISVIETLNGGSRGTENEEAIALAEEYGYRGIGGSDAHIVSFVGRCATRFEKDVASTEDLVSELKAGRFEAVSYK